MGSYLHQVYGSEFEVILDGQSVPARRLKYLEKPYYEEFDRSAQGRVPSYLDDWSKRQIRRYILMRARWSKMSGARVLVFPPVHDQDGKSFSIRAGLRCLVYDTPKVWVWDDPDWDRGKAGVLSLAEGSKTFTVTT